MNVQTRVWRLDTASGLTTELVRVGIVFPSTQRHDMGWCDHNIVPWVWDYLNAHPKLLVEN